MRDASTENKRPGAKMKMQRTEMTLFLGMYNSVKLLFLPGTIDWEGGVPISPHGIPRWAQVYRKTRASVYTQARM